MVKPQVERKVLEAALNWIELSCGCKPSELPPVTRDLRLALGMPLLRDLVIVGQDADGYDILESTGPEQSSNYKE